jgi:HlyD family secretion protein
VRQKLAVIGGLGCLAVLGLLSVAFKRHDAAVAVYAEPVERREIVQTIAANGEVDARTKVHVSSHVIGRIERLYVEEGQPVAAGQPLLELEKDAFLAARDRARAGLDIARLRLRQAEIDLAEAESKKRRFERLAEAQIVSAELLETTGLRLESAQVAREQAERLVTQAEVDLSKAEEDLAKTTIYSPIDGKIVSLFAKEGEVVVSGTLNNPASVIGTICDLSDVVVDVAVDETEIVDVAVGQRAEVVADAVPERTLVGRVIEIGNAGYHLPNRPEVTYFKARIAFDEPVPALRPGMSVRATIRTAAAPGALSVPLQALGDWSADGAEAAAGEEPAGPSDSYALVVEDGRVHRRKVEAGLADDTHVEVLSGLAEGERVVTGPQRDLRELADGVPVRVLAGAGEEA